MKTVKPKKFLGQHFLNDLSIAEAISRALLHTAETQNILEIGPGMGVLSQYLPLHKNCKISLIEIDRDSVNYLKEKYTQNEFEIIEGDFLRIDLKRIIPNQVSLIGNFPYNISSQIFFKVLDHKEMVKEVVCMLQKEVALRIASPPGKKDYGILSVFLQAWYNIEYLFQVEPDKFTPPPNVKSAVIRLVRNQNKTIDCDFELFIKVVKTGFNQRRKTLSNALSGMVSKQLQESLPFMALRAEQLSYKDFILLTQKIEKLQK